MFEGTRSNLAKRLGNLIDRFETIAERSDKWRDEGSLAIRMGLGGSTAIYDEISSKARDQAGLCGESISLLLVNRAFPLTFKRGVSRAENFARQCEAVLDESDREQAAGKAAFRDRYGS